MSEMAVTDMDANDVDKLNLKMQQSIQISCRYRSAQCEDPDYWGEYNIIKPDDPLKAIDSSTAALKSKCDHTKTKSINFEIRMEWWNTGFMEFQTQDRIK